MYRNTVGLLRQGFYLAVDNMKKKGYNTLAEKLLV